MKSTIGTALCAIFALSLAFSQVSGAPPKLHGETASGKSIDLPDAAAGKTTLLIIGFSKTAGDKCSPWEKRVSTDFGQDAKFAVYAVAMLEKVPGLVRGMVKSSIRNGRPKDLRDNMVMTTSGEKEWSKFCGVTDDKVPYLVLLDSTGKVRWTGQGLFDESHYQPLHDAIAGLRVP